MAAKSVDETKAKLWHNRGIVVWRLFCFIFLLCLLIPLRYSLLKVGLVAGGVGTWGLGWYIFQDRKSVRIICSIVALAVFCVMIFLALPGRPNDTDALKHEYVKSLLSYKGSLYVWGGGNHLGIDCSGLVEAGMIDACIARAAASGNPGLAREALSLWWHNRSAKALGEGYRGDTRLLAKVTSLKKSDYNTIKPGDLAVLSDGIHVLAYLGNNTWIEADPAPIRVIEETSPCNADIYFNISARIMRWRALE